VNSAGFDTDVAIIGSGFGGSVSALRLAEKDYRVTVFEAGRPELGDGYRRVDPIPPGSPAVPVDAPAALKW
jgi:cholesterol oxidase